MLIVGRELSNLCKKVALCRLGNLTWRLRKIKRRFGKIKRRFDRLKRRFVLPVSQSVFCKIGLLVFETVKPNNNKKR